MSPIAWGTGECRITSDFPHQTSLLEATVLDPAWAIFWEQGCGKSRPTIETMVRWYLESMITCVLVVAPGGVHTNWISDELPAHCRVPWVGLDYHSSKGKTKRQASELAELARDRGMQWLSMTYDALLTKEGLSAARTFCKGRRFGFVVDEGSRIKNPSAKRTKQVQGIANSPSLGVVRVLNGTPVTNSPTDVYAQMKVLDERYWERLGIATWTAFEGRFVVKREIVVGAHQDEIRDVDAFRPLAVGNPTAEDIAAFEAEDSEAVYDDDRASMPADDVAQASRSTGRKVKIRVGYRDLETLGAMIRPRSSRLTKEDAGLNLPPKLYNTIRFDLTPKQRAAYDRMRTEFMIELDSGALVTAPIAMTRILRLQQIACGYLPDPDDPEAEPISMVGADEENPRLDVFSELIESTPHKAIIWARFTRDVDLILARLAEMKRGAVRYDGLTPTSARKPAIDAFRRGDAQFFVAKAATIGVGVTLVEAKSVLYYSNDFSLERRLQSEDRAHRIGQTSNVGYYDFVANGTVDVKILESLRKNQEMAARVTGDVLREWLTI